MSSYVIFLISAGCGVVSGIIYDILYIIRSIICGMPAKVLTLKDRIVAAVCDIIYFASLTALFVICMVIYDFPDLRLYMFVAVLCGIILYLKSFHKTIDFFINKLYNRITKR